VALCSQMHNGMNNLINTMFWRYGNTSDL